MNYREIVETLVENTRLSAANVATVAALLCDEPVAKFDLSYPAQAAEWVRTLSGVKVLAQSMNFCTRDFILSIKIVRDESIKYQGGKALGLKQAKDAVEAAYPEEIAKMRGNTYRG